MVYLPGVRKSIFLPTGLPSLDRFLGGGWPAAAVTELTGKPGGGKTSLALRSAAEITKRKRWVALVSPGEILFPPAIASEGIDLPYLLWLRPAETGRCRWAVEQVARSGLFPLVIVSHVPYDERSARRLQLTSEERGSTVLFLTSDKAQANLWALALRLQVERRPAGIARIEVLRSRKMFPKPFMEVSLNDDTNPVPLLPEPALARGTS
jgi:hypothetical protein